MRFTFYHWNELDFFFSSVTAQKYLNKCYKKRGVENSEQKSFENCYKFIYHLEHGKNYLDSARNSPTSIKPVLLFYGLVQLLKACLITIDPLYPETTTVLAHGVTSRKKKRQNYEFLTDEVRVQKNGLFSHFLSKMYGIDIHEGEKFCMQDIINTFPELNNLILNTTHQKLFTPVDMIKNQLTVDSNVLDYFHMTKERFSDYLISKEYGLEKNYSVENNITFNATQDFSIYHRHILFSFHIYNHQYFLPLKKPSIPLIPEILRYYLVFYNLSMLSRYETEWWGEILHSYATLDYPFINQIAEIAQDKIPFHILSILYE